MLWILIQGTGPEGREHGLEKMIDELYWLSKKAIASGIHVSFEIGLMDITCRVWVEEPPESKMTTYDIYREEVMMKESVKNYEAARASYTVGEKMDLKLELIRIRYKMDKNSLSPSYCRREGKIKNQKYVFG